MAPEDIKKDLDDLLAKTPMEFFSKMEHDLRGVINALYGWWTLYTDEDAKDFHAEACEQVQVNIDAMIAIVGKMKTYKDHYRAQQSKAGGNTDATEPESTDPAPPEKPSGSTDSDS